MDSRGKNFNAIGVPKREDGDVIAGTYRRERGASPATTSLPVNRQHDFAVGAFAQELQDVEVLRRVHGRQGLGRQVAQLLQELGGCLEEHEQSRVVTTFLWSGAREKKNCRT